MIPIGTESESVAAETAISAISSPERKELRSQAAKNRCGPRGRKKQQQLVAAASETHLVGARRTVSRGPNPASRTGAPGDTRGGGRDRGHHQQQQRGAPSKASLRCVCALLSTLSGSGSLESSGAPSNAPPKHRQKLIQDG
ncbi:Hypothetical predicted protein [Cloeon dipterum]|uniref:Uncharacterized protein n=1 Tax=Cloeon dipterum TaxID=197152 RepID=A0A8S1CKT6_9INSE|nr:Hypothetical predicted protein [Cloeon dipterum]